MRVMKQHAPSAIRVTPGAVRLMRAILEQKAESFSKKAHWVSKTIRGTDGEARVMAKDAEIVLKFAN